MNIHNPTSIWEDATLYEQLAGRKRRRAPGSAKYMLFGTFGTIVAIAIPMLFVLAGIGMTQQDLDIAFSAALASLLAIICSFIIIRRLLSFPLLKTYGYVALTFVSSFAIVAVGLKFFRIDFSSPQFFLAMVVILGMVEMFFYVNRQWVPVHMAVIPGTSTLAKLPEVLAGSVRFTMINSVPGPDFVYNGVIADLGSDLDPNWERFLALSALRNIPVYHVKQFNEAITGRVAVDHLRENTLGAVVPSLIYPQFKRVFDVVVALLLLPPGRLDTRNMCDFH